MKRLWLGGIVVGAAVASAAFAAGGTTVYINGTRASGRVKMIDGIAYAPIVDIVKSYGQTITRRKDGDWEVGAAGGANQVGNIQGKQGQEVFTGKYRFSVTAVEEAQSYAYKYKDSQDTVEAKSPGKKLVIVSCRIKNGVPTKQSLLMDVGGDYGAPDTALTTQDEQSFPPINWGPDTVSGGVDVLADVHGPSGIHLLPGAACNLNLIFLVPKDAQVKDLIFCLTPLDQYSEGNHKKFTDVRINLNPPTKSNHPSF